VPGAVRVTDGRVRVVCVDLSKVTEADAGDTV